MVTAGKPPNDDIEDVVVSGIGTYADPGEGVAMLLGFSVIKENKKPFWMTQELWEDAMVAEKLWRTLADANIRDWIEHSPAEQSLLPADGHQGEIRRLDASS